MEELTVMARQGGGKARNLALMSQRQLPVPPWFAVGKSAFEEFIAFNQLEELLSRMRADEAFEKEVLTAFAAAELPPTLADELAQAVDFHFKDQFVAVRSSGLDEDAGEHSFAGQFSSFLFQRGIAQVTSALKSCWASAYSARVLSYRKRNNLPLAPIEMGVVIQKMVQATSAGVLFSRHPLKVLSRDLVLISGVWGAGEGLVSGELSADSYTYCRKQGTIQKEIVAKKEQLVQAEPFGLAKAAVADALVEKPCLSDEQVIRLAKLADELESCCGSPQDAEWVFDHEELFLVQTRPITTLPSFAFYDARVNGDRPTLWDNSNIIESYSGVTSPLTFSFASMAYHQVYIQFLQIMGVPQQVIDAYSGTFRNLLGLIRGRIYYNLVHWYELVLMLPGSSHNKGFMETMMGVKQGMNADLTAIFEQVRNPPRYKLSAKALLLVKTLYRFFNIDRIINDFFSHFNAVYNESRARDWRALSLPELRDGYFYLEEMLLKRWQAPIINDYLCMIFFGLLKKLTGRWLTGEDKESLQNDLLCGEGGLDSTEPTKHLMRLAELIDHGDADFRAWFLTADIKEIQAVLMNDESQVAREFAAFIDHYGFRCPNELKLEEPDFHDDPSFVVYSLQSYIRTRSYSIKEMETREREIRGRAEQRVNSQLSGLKRRLYSFVLSQARKAVRNRENLRFARTKTFGISRHLFRAMGDRLCALGCLAREEDVFYLTLDELMGFIEGRASTLDLKAVVALRQAEFAAYRATPEPPERFISKGAIGVFASYPHALTEADLLAGERSKHVDPSKLYGTPCCPGTVEGVVRVVAELGDARDLDGMILVTARTDPGWVPLFPSLRGLLIERGSLLSHSAVVARELGLPTVVSISGGLMKRLKNGDRVRIDASKGEITILDKGKEGTHQHEHPNI
jgi:pyruvate,water dikinase